MKLPRDISGSDLAKALRRLGYQITRQTGSHLGLTTEEGGQHHVTVPHHNSIKIDTLSGILADVAAHFNTSRDEVVQRLFAA